MTDEQIFGLANAVPLLGWLALCLAPLARAGTVAAARMVAVVLAVGYTVMVGSALATAGRPLPDLTTLPGLAHAFADPHVMLIGWVHYLAFDLWTGAWEVEEAGRRAMSHWAVLPCLMLTFLAGPVGLLVFLALRTGWRKAAVTG
jgi:hypothetical protein